RSRATLFPYTTLFRSGPQKGASPEQVETLDAGLKQLAKRFLNDLGCDVSEMPGAGGGGGFGGGAAAFFRAVLRPGIEVIFEHTEDRKSTRLNSSHVKI